MKKKLVLITIMFTILSCDKKSRSFVINDFSKPIKEDLVPNEDPFISYGVAYCKISGYSNDTISISFWGIERKYSGSFSDEWNMDFYGKQNVKFEFNPLRANKGEIEVEFKIE